MGEWVNITVEVTDDNAVDTVWITVVAPDGSSNNVSMSKGPGDVWYYNATYPNIGFYYYTVWANDTDDNWNHSDTGRFRIIKNTPPWFANIEAEPNPQERGGYVNVSVDVSQST